jgi:Fe(II)/alpha-ketoglutarate-dependent arginine beta-hydroxylase
MYMDVLEIDSMELRDLAQLLDEVEEELGNISSADVLRQFTVYAHRIPSRIRHTLNEFRLEQMSGVLLLTGYVTDQQRVGPTPAHWNSGYRTAGACREELLLLLLSTLIGDPFCWATQQDGKLIHDVLPIKGHEQEQLGSSSESLLTWHTEDAFHPLRGDFLGFACLRNPYAAATTIGYIDALDLPEAIKTALFEQRFRIRPDESHLPKNNAAQSEGTFTGINKAWQEPEPVAVLFGDPAKPYIRADPYFMTVAPDDHEARYALNCMVKEMDEKMFDLQLAGGDFCFVDNFRVVHGRKPFTPRHDGTDRWLKRLNIT